MIFKILMLLLVVAGLIYWIKQPRGVQPVAYAPARPRRPAFIALCIAAAIAAIAALARATTSAEAAAAYRGERLTFGPDYLIPKPFDPRLLPINPTRA